MTDRLPSLPPNDPKRWLFAPWSHRHRSGSSRRSDDCRLPSLPQTTKKMEHCPLATPAPTGFPVGPKVWQRDHLPNIQKAGSLPLGHTDSTGWTSVASSGGRFPPSHVHQHKDSQITRPSVAVSAELEQLNPRGSRPPKRKFFSRYQPRRPLRRQPHFIPAERQLRFRRACPDASGFHFGNIHSPGGASCKDCGGSLSPSRYRFPLVK